MLAYFVAALAPSMDVANAALPVYVTTLLFFGGFLFTFSTMPPWWKWYSFINPLRCGSISSYCLTHVVQVVSLHIHHHQLQQQHCNKGGIPTSHQRATSDFLQQLDSMSHIIVSLSNILCRAQFAAHAATDLLLCCACSCRYSWTAVMLNQFEAIDPVWLGGQTVLEYYGVAGQSKWANLGYVAAFFWFFM